MDRRLLIADHDATKLRLHKSRSFPTLSNRIDLSASSKCLPNQLPRAPGPSYPLVRHQKRRILGWTLLCCGTPKTPILRKSIAADRRSSSGPQRCRKRSPRIRGLLSTTSTSSTPRSAPQAARGLRSWRALPRSSPISRGCPSPSSKTGWRKATSSRFIRGSLINSALDPRRNSARSSSVR